jgi:hypothetical protein
MQLFCRFQFVDFYSPFTNGLLPRNLWLLTVKTLHLVEKVFNEFIFAALIQSSRLSTDGSTFVLSWPKTKSLLFQDYFLEVVTQCIAGYAEIYNYIFILRIFPNLKNRKKLSCRVYLSSNLMVCDDGVLLKYFCVFIHRSS